MQIDATRASVAAAFATLAEISNVAISQRLDHGAAELTDMVHREQAAHQAQIQRRLLHIEKRFQQIHDLLPALANVARLKEMIAVALDLRAIVDQALDRLNRSDAIHVHWRPPAEAVLVEGDAALLQEAIFSILENACEAMPEGGFLNIRLQREGDGFVTIYVTDSGAGVPTAIRDRIFEPGFSTRANTGENTRRGQGLFVSRAIFRWHGGDVSLHEGGQETGATFACRLPWLRATL